MYIYIYTHEQSQNSPSKIKCSRFIWQTKETMKFSYQLRTKLTKAQTNTKLKQAANWGINQ